MSFQQGAFSKYCEFCHLYTGLHQPLYLRRPRPDRALGLGGGHLLLQPLEVLGLLRLLRLLLLVHLHAGRAQAGTPAAGRLSREQRYIRQ